MIPFEPLPPQEIWPRLKAGSSLITVNRRLARSFALQYAKALRFEGYTVWETPDILPFAGWLRRLVERADPETSFFQHRPPPIVLERHQQRVVWERIISESDSRHSLQVPEAAEAVMDAWEILQGWRISMEELRAEAVEDSAVFLEWSERYAQRCEENNWLDTARLGSWIISGLSSLALHVPEELILAGFDQLSPQQEELFEALAARGCSLFIPEAPVRCASVLCAGLADRTAEIREAAKWTRSNLEEQPGLRTGIVVPDLSSRRFEISRILDSIFQPETLLLENLDNPRVFNLSLGDPLSELPLVRAGLLLLESVQGWLDLDSAGELLRSPFLAGGESESTLRAGLDLRLRRIGEPRVTANDLLWTARQGGAYGPAPILAESLEELHSQAERLPERQRPSAWLQSFQDILYRMGWPGERSLSSVEFQALLSWQEVQARLAELDRVAGLIDFNQALSQFKRLTRETVFQASQAEVPVQVLGLLEASGESFDCLWIMGLHSEIWPPKPEANPLLPAALQRRFETPHSSAERELAFAKRVTERLIHSADKVVVSYPMNEDDRQLFPSPLLSELPRAEQEALDAGRYSDYWRMIFESGRPETLKDVYGPPLKQRENLGGGTGLIKAQSDCPFRAFAKYRLGVEAMPAPVLGLGASERGTLVHAALMHIWRELGGREDLLNLSSEDTGALVRAAAERAVSVLSRRKPRTFTPRFKSLEQSRLQALLREWLEVEALRPDFRVHGVEQKQSLELPGLSLEILVDRIDRLADGRVLILDYKTGRHGIKEWFGERLSQPQLPMYALACPEEIAGLAFAQVRRGESRFLGLIRSDQLLPGGVPFEKSEYTAGISSWSALLDHWQVSIHSLVREITRGYAAVAPNTAASACERCDLGPLCRRDGASPLPSPGEEANGIEAD